MLDELIDQVARELTAVSPPRDLGRRIADAVADAGSLRVSQWPARWTWALVAAAVLVAAVIVVRETRTPAPMEVRPVLVARDVRLTSDAVPDRPATRTIAADSARRRATAQESVRAPSAGAAASTDVEPLTMGPIEMEALQITPLARAEPIDIEPIAIDQIDIAALP
jgi:hypothetical protein